MHVIDYIDIQVLNILYMSYVLFLADNSVWNQITSVGTYLEIMSSRGPFCQHWLSLIPVWLRNHMLSKAL